MMVPFGDLGREAREIGDAVSAAIQGVLDSGWFILGPEVEAFEVELASRLEVSFVVGVASGTEAITVALRALDVGPGDEVITAANTCVPTAAGIAGSGATLRLADCEPDTLMISPDSVEAAITPRTRALVPVHLYGGGADIEGLRELADRRGLFIVEDCAQAIGTTIRGTKAGTHGDAAAFSFYPTKNLGAYGDGGCVVTSASEVCERARRLRNYGYVERDRSVELGLNLPTRPYPGGHSQGQAAVCGPVAQPQTPDRDRLWGCPPTTWRVHPGRAGLRRAVISSVRYQGAGQGKCPVAAGGVRNPDTGPLFTAVTHAASLEWSRLQGRGLSQRGEGVLRGAEPAHVPAADGRRGGESRRRLDARPSRGAGVTVGGPGIAMIESPARRR